MILITRKENDMWINTRDRNPSEDGCYLVQNAMGGVMASEYTPEGGWNTHRNVDGTVDAETEINLYIVRWYKGVEEPEPVPEEWYEEWLRG